LAEQLRNEGYEPLALLSLLSKIGTSDPVEARDSLEQLALEFSFDKMGRAPARFDENELNGLNAQIVHAMSFEMVRPRLAKLAYGDQATPDFWDVVKGNLQSVPDAALWLAVVYGGGLTGPDLDAEDKAFIGEAAALFPEGDVTLATWKAWVDAVKAKTGRKGKGLFQPLRRVLTDQEHGPEMDRMLVLIGGDKARDRLVQASP
jgi:glutamyl-tRNA synthetase